MHAPHHEGRARPLSLCLDLYCSMASLDSSLSEADRMAQGACNGAETMRPDYASSGGFIGTGPDSARQIDSVDSVETFDRANSVDFPSIKNKTGDELQICWRCVSI